MRPWVARMSEECDQSKQKEYSCVLVACLASGKVRDAALERQRTATLMRSH